jgi:hypothetical protein
MNLFGKKFECKACGIKFKSEEELMQHVRMHIAGTHQQEDHSTHEHFSCNACRNSFHSKEELKQHGQKHRM